MGTCVSKCYSCDPPIPPPPPPGGYRSGRLLPEVEKVALSKSPPPTLPLHGEFSIKLEVSTLSSSSTTSSLTSTSSSAAAAASSSSSTSIDSFAQSSSIHKPKEDVLDPQKHGAGTPIRCSPRRLDQTRKAPGAIPKQAFGRVNQPFPAKRSRSSSPVATRTGRKSFRSENRQAGGGAAFPAPRNSSSSPSPLQSSITNATSPRQRGHQHLVEPPAANAVPARWRKENVRPLSSCSSQGRRRSSGMEKGAFLHHIQEHQPRPRHAVMVDQSGSSREVFHNHPLLKEDLNNPLIAMDCFIFL